jgi:hypothetical protein
MSDTNVEVAARGRAMRQLTDVEVRQFYAAYRAMEASAHSLDAIARGYHDAAIRYALQRDLILALGVAFFLLLAAFLAL